MQYMPMYNQSDVDELCESVHSSDFMFYPIQVSDALVLELDVESKEDREVTEVQEQV